MSKDLSIVILKKQDKEFLILDTATQEPVRPLNPGDDFWLLNESENKFIKGRIQRNRYKGLYFICKNQEQVVYLQDGVEGKINLQHQ